MPEHDTARIDELLALRRSAFTETTVDDDKVRASLSQRKAINHIFGGLYTGVLEILQRHDPIGIALAADDEYAAEVDTVVLRLHEANSIAELRRIIWEEFVWWFSSAGGSWEQKLADNDAGPEENYTEIAREIWELWTSTRSSEQH